MENNYYIYLHKRKDTGEIFYVGKGTKGKKSKHYHRARSKSGRNFIWHRITSKSSYDIIIYQDFDDEGLCVKREAELIKEYGQIIENTGPLSNISNEVDKFCISKDNMGVKNRIPVYQYSLDGNFIAEYISQTEASKVTGILKCDITAACRGKRRKHTAGGFQWRDFKTEFIPSFNLLANYRYENPIVQYNLDGTFIKEWKTVSRAARELQLNRSGIANCLAKISGSSGGYLWKYKECHRVHHEKEKQEEAA